MPSAVNEQITVEVDATIDDINAYLANDSIPMENYAADIKWKLTEMRKSLKRILQQHDRQTPTRTAKKKAPTRTR